MSGVATGVFLSEDEIEEVNRILREQQAGDTFVFQDPPQFIEPRNELYKYIEKIALDRGLFFQEQKLYTGYFTINVINAEIIWVPTR